MIIRPWIERAETRVKLIVAALAVVLGILYCHSTWSAGRSLAAKADAAIFHILKHGIPEYKIYPCDKWHPLARSPEMRARLAAAIAAASERYRIPVYFLVAVAWREGSFINDKRGDLGEQSTFQIHGLHKRRCKPLGYGLDTYEGAAMCAAYNFNLDSAQCGSLKRGLVFYATGRTCKPDTGHLRWLVRDRMGIAKHLEGVAQWQK